MTFEADANSYEAAAERKAEQKLLFHPCRRWYADKRNVRLQAAHGLFPAMWMELEAWAGWKSVRKEYLKFQDTGEWAGAAPAAPRPAQGWRRTDRSPQTSVAPYVWRTPPFLANGRNAVKPGLFCEPSGRVAVDQR